MRLFLTLEVIFLKDNLKRFLGQLAGFSGPKGVGKFVLFSIHLLVFPGVFLGNARKDTRNSHNLLNFLILPTTLCSHPFSLSCFASFLPFLFCSPCPGLPTQEISSSTFPFLETQSFFSRGNATFRGPHGEGVGVGCHAGQNSGYRKRGLISSQDSPRQTEPKKVREAEMTIKIIFEGSSQKGGRQGVRKEGQPLRAQRLKKFNLD